MKPRRPLAWALSLVLVITSAAGCDRGDEQSNGIEEPVPVEGGTLHVAVAGSPELDPAFAVDRRDVAAVGLLYDTLVTLDPVTLEPRPGLARDWEASDDQRRFTFTLADDAHFHDGASVTASDVVAAWNRIVDPATESPLAPLLEVVDGYEDARADGAELAGLDGSRGSTVVVELSESRSDFPATLAHPALGIGRPDGTGPEAVPVGSGPFVFDERDGDVIRLIAHDEGAAYLEGIELRVVADAATAAEEVADGAADLALVDGDTTLAEGTVEARFPFLAVSYYAMNLEHPGLADERVRAAIALSIDPAAVVEAGYREAAAPAVSVAPTPLPGVGPEVCGARCGPDRERAIELLTEVFGDESPSRVTLDFDETEVQGRVAAEIARQLAEVGIDSELRPIPPEDYDSFLVDDEPMVFRLGWVSDIPTPRGFLSPLFLPDVPENVTRVEVSEVPAALERAAVAEDSAERAEAYRSAQAAVLDTFAVIPLAQLVTRYATRRSVEGLQLTPFGGFSGTEVWLQPREE